MTEPWPHLRRPNVSNGMLWFERFTQMKKFFIAVLTSLSFLGSTAVVVNAENQISKFERCTVSKSGRVTCKSEGSQRRVWNNGKSRGYYWTNP